MKKARRALTLLGLAAILAVGPYFMAISYADSPSIPSSVEVALAYADTEGRGNGAGACANCFPSPWCGSPGVQFIGSSTNYDGNSTEAKNCNGGDWDTGAILVINSGASSITLTNLTVAFPLPASGASVTPTCTAEMRPITIDVWFGQQYYWDNPADPAFNGGPITVPAGGQAIFAGTSSDNSYNCPTGNYPSTGPTNGTYDFDSSDAYYLNGCTPTTDPSSAPRITFSAVGYASTTYKDNGHTIDTGGIDTGNCAPTPADPQWGHENLGWRLVNDTCGEICPTNQLGVETTTSKTNVGGESSTSTTTTPTVNTSSSSPATTVNTSSAFGGINTSIVYGIAVVVVIFIAAGGYLVVRGRRRP
jgi:hypothetical protein